MNRTQTNPAWSSPISLWLGLKGHFSHRLSKHGDMLQYVCKKKAVICKFTPLSLTVIQCGDQAIMSKLFSRDEEDLNKQQTSGQKVMLLRNKNPEVNTWWWVWVRRQWTSFKPKLGTPFDAELLNELYLKFPIFIGSFHSPSPAPETCHTEHTSIFRLKGFFNSASCG